MMIPNSPLNTLLKDDYPLHHNIFIQHLQILGLSLIAVSVLYLIAANWFMLPQFIQLAIPPILLIITTVASIFLNNNERLVQTLHGISGLMLGLSLAVIGQIYQTGADSFLLFVGWALLLLPWLYRPNIAVFSLFCVVSHLALALFFQQTFWFETHYKLCLLIINIWTACLFLICLKFYPIIRFAFLVWIGIFSIGCMINFLIEKQLITFISSLFLPLLFAGYFYLKKDALSTSLATLIVGIDLTLWIMEAIVSQASSSVVGTLFISALIILAWFTALTVMLKKLFPTSFFSVIPLAVGAWLAGILLASTLLVAWEEASLIFALITFIGALIFLKQAKQIFSRQFAYCLLFCGQIAFLGHLLIFIESPFITFVIQMIFLLILTQWRLHWFALFLQIFALYLLGIFSILQLSDTFDLLDNGVILYWQLLNFCFYSLMFTLPYLNNSAYIRSIFLTLLGIFITSVFFNPNIPLLGQEIEISIWATSILYWFFPIVWSILFFIFVVRPQSSLFIQITYCVLSAVLIACQFFEILPLFMILAWCIKSKDKLIHGLTIVSIILFLWLLYYSLDLSFLIKSLTIFISGSTILFLAIQLKSNTTQLEINS